jgi:hypothetical protein
MVVYVATVIQTPVGAAPLGEADSEGRLTHLGNRSNSSCADDAVLGVTHVERFASVHGGGRCLARFGPSTASNFRSADHFLVTAKVSALRALVSAPLLLVGSSYL